MMKLGGNVEVWLASCETCAMRLSVNDCVVCESGNAPCGVVGELPLLDGGVPGRMLPRGAVLRAYIVRSGSS